MPVDNIRFGSLTYKDYQKYTYVTKADKRDCFLRFIKNLEVLINRFIYLIKNSQPISNDDLFTGLINNYRTKIRRMNARGWDRQCKAHHKVADVLFIKVLRSAKQNNKKEALYHQDLSLYKKVSKEYKDAKKAVKRLPSSDDSEAEVDPLKTPLKNRPEFAFSAEMPMGSPLKIMHNDAADQEEFEFVIDGSFKLKELFSQFVDLMKSFLGTGEKAPLKAFFERQEYNTLTEAETAVFCNFTWLKQQGSEKTPTSDSRYAWILHRLALTFPDRTFEKIREATIPSVQTLMDSVYLYGLLKKEGSNYREIIPVMLYSDRPSLSIKQWAKVFSRCDLDTLASYFGKYQMNECQLLGLSLAFKKKPEYLPKMLEEDLGPSFDENMRLLGSLCEQDETEEVQKLYKWLKKLSPNNKDTEYLGHVKTDESFILI